MRHGATGRRLRNRGSGGGTPGNGNPRRHGGNGGSGNRNQVFDSNGPDVRIRGTAHQIQEKIRYAREGRRGQRRPNCGRKLFATC